jgi:hypothetical protein
MALSTGTHTIADLASNAFAATTVQEFGLENLNDAIVTDLNNHNARVNEIVGDFADRSTERSTIYGTSAEGEAVPADEFTRGPTQQIRPGSKVEFPLEKFQYAVGWTADYLRRATVQDMAKKTIAARQAHVKRIQKDIRDALFGATNYIFNDRFVDGMDLQVKRLVNADGMQIPSGPNAETFDAATHTHYDALNWAGATPDARAAALRALILDVVEHGHGADVRLYINRAQDAEVRVLPGFVALQPANIVAANTATSAGPGAPSLDIARADNRMIGYFDGYPVWTKPWVPPLYFLASALGDPRKPLRMRISTIAAEQGLYIAGDIIIHPLQARYFEFWHGFGAMQRTNAAILFGGGASYTVPVFTL